MRMTSLANSWVCTSGACGPSRTLKQFSKSAWALSSARRSVSTDANGSPALERAQTTPTVMLLTAPGFSINGPADCTKRRSLGVLFAVCSVQLGCGLPLVPQPSGSVLPGNMKSQGMLGSASGSEIWPLPPYTNLVPSFQNPRR